MPSESERQPHDRSQDTTTELVRLAAQRWPDAEAIVDGDRRITFRELDELVTRTARAALANGLEPGDRAAIWAPNSWHWIVTALAVHRAGGAIVPMTTRYKGGEAAYVLSSSHARFLFTVRGFLGLDLPALLEGHPTSVERTVVFGEASWDEFHERSSDAPFPIVSPDDVSDVIFTSGTTGRPKGVVSVHAQTVGVTREWAAIVGLRPGDRYLHVSPFSHTSGYKAGFVGALLAGATSYPMAVVDPGDVLRLIDRERITMLPGSPTVFQSILDHPEREHVDLSSLRLSAVGAASVPVELVERMRSELFDTVVTGYGLTETTGVSTMSRHDDPPEIVSRTVGRALPGVEVEIVDDDGNAVPAGTPGEVLVRGFNVMQGYFDDPERTAEVLTRDGWLHTGDIGVLDDDGYLHITDRKKDMFISGGFNAYPAEIEADLLRHDAISMAAVIGVPDERLGEVGMAFVVPKPGRPIDPDELVQWARREMASYKAPRSVVIVDELPMNAAGKVVKPELRARAAGEVAPGSVERDPGTKR